ncbi:unnamed protein product [Didymodactylos carnosus]|uniref:U4/U6.U5 small nuclear ribonucleoprotein 27 kDa protein n=1 Tax=Didymodactylos carnosus TaxID=1234261 RepID=A0A813SPS3_9BILA|nr:unnamed protein product [Didymodactylos carnosus]CAF0800002.1 unnamed protein product [Didymodactylos carnosus]CAF3501372.1 unnamed protein product [Didymodactylos carnosus]CAF3584937.1 unnamed protein product [Didymodactylos carnosus]
MPRSRSKSPRERFDRRYRGAPGGGRSRDLGRRRSHSRSPIREYERERDRDRRDRNQRQRTKSRSTSPKAFRGEAFGNKLVRPSDKKSDRYEPPTRIFDPSELEGKTEDEIEMMKTMGFATFDTTKGKHTEGSTNAFAANIQQKRRYRQYMNRKGGFNRPLDPIA